MSKVIWKPQAKQHLFMSTPEFEALYGGAAGGGKSDALVVEALRQVHDKKYRAIIFRKTYPQLTELIDRSIEIYKMSYPAARYNDSKHLWTFPSGAKIFFASMQHSKDKTNYQGKQYQYIAFDELTHFTWEEYSYLMSRCRARGPGQRCYMRASANPGGIGHGWVRERFVDNEPYKRIYEYVEIESRSILRDRIFIPATLFDNKILLENDPNYLANLALMGEKDRNALLYGSWDEYEGQYYPEFKRNTHVVVPFELPQEWRRFRSLDYGLDKTACYWWAIDTRGTCFIYREFYESGLKLSDAARKIVSLTPETEKMDYTVSSPDLWNRRQETGESGFEIMTKAGLKGIIKANDNRIAGWRTLREYLSVQENGIEKTSRLKVFQNCTNLIRCLPLLQHDDKNVEDVADEPHEITHAPESIRYGVMSRPRLSALNTQHKPQWEHEKPQPNAFTGGEIDSSYINY